jgi:hypothetical protein
MAKTGNSTSASAVLPDASAQQCQTTTFDPRSSSLPLSREERDTLCRLLRAAGAEKVKDLREFADDGLRDDWIIPGWRSEVSWIFDALRELDDEASSYSVTVTWGLIRLVEGHCASVDPEGANAEVAEAILGKLWGCDGPLPKVELTAVERQVLRDAAESWAWAAGLDLEATFEGQHGLDQERRRYLERSLSAIDALGWERDGAAARQPRELRATPPVIEMLRGESTGTDCDVIKAACRATLERCGVECS